MEIEPKEQSKLQSTLATASDVIEKTFEEKDASLALGFARNIERMKTLGGIAQAKVFHALFHRWDELGTGGNPIDTIVSWAGVTAFTVDRYIAAWEYIENIPVEEQQEFLRLGIGRIIPLGKAHQQGYEITEEHREYILQKPTYNEVNDYVREEVKEAEPRASKIIWKMDRLGGVYIYKAGERHFVMSIDINSTDPTVQLAAERVIAKMNIRRL